MNGITNIEYDLLGNPRKITFSNNRSIEYIYSADGRRLRTIHSKPKEAGIFDRPIRAKLRPGGIETMAMDKDSTDYIGNLILKDGHPSQYLFAGGYASFDAKADTLNGMHYYISDYLGNNRMVVNQDGTIEQVTHYYPYGPRSHKKKIDNLLARRRGLSEGGVIGDISHTNDDVTNDYKFENKELDRTFGLDWYDIQARQYDAIGVPGWNAIDPLSEKYYSISPYAYCGGNPVNFGDYDGRDMCVLIEPSAAFGHGHIAVLIQHGDGRYYLYSKNGAFFSKSQSNPLPYGPAIKNNKGTDGYDSPQDFMDSDDNKNKDGATKYSMGVVLKCGEQADEEAAKSATEELRKLYWLLGHNCAKTVQSALQATGDDELKECGGEPNAKYIDRKSPNTIFDYIIEKYKQIKGEDPQVVTPSNQNNDDEKE